MPQGTGATTLQSIPTDPYVIDPAAFFQMTKRNEATPKNFSDPGDGQFHSEQLPQAGVISKLFLHFVGQVVVAGGAATTSNQWPYNLLKGFKLSANGQTDLWNCNGIDLAVLRFLKYPAYIEHVDQFPGTAGGGDSVANGTYPLDLSWEIPIAIDDTTLVGALYAQSNQTNLTITASRALQSDLFSTLPGTATITGTFYVQETFFEIPFDGSGHLVLPDLTRLHGFNALETSFTANGQVRTPLIRGAGQLERLIMSWSKGANARLSALPSAAAANKIDRLAVTYGINQTPFDWNPASKLLRTNNDHYGAPAPFDRLILDTLRENPVRDAIFMQGLTELATLATINSAVSVTAGIARVVQETLF